jgi:hypothetical protein
MRQSAGLEHSRGELHLGNRLTGEIALLDATHLTGGVGVEVAVAASRQAKRHVQVNA